MGFHKRICTSGLGWLALGVGGIKKILRMDKRRLLQRGTMDNIFAQRAEFF